MKNPYRNFPVGYSQNEIVNKRIIEKLVSQSSINFNDTVYDIGAGTGIISAALLKKGARVIAIERDRDRYLKCKARFIGQDKFELYLDDFLIRDYIIAGKYKVFSNIPFIHTAEIFDKLLLSKNPPEDCYLVLQKEVAEKYAGIPKDTLVSLFLKPLFWIDIVYHFQRTDFYPVPSVDVVLLQIEKRKCQLIPSQHYNLYKDFIVTLREEVDKTIKKSLKKLFSYHHMKHLRRLLDIDFKSSPADINFNQYLCLFQFYIDYDLKNKALIQGAEERLRQQQSNIIKIHRAPRTGRKVLPSEL